MQFYTFGKSSEDSISDMVDSKELAIILEKRYELSQYDGPEEESKELKKIIKNKKEFKSLVEDTKIEIPDLIRSLVHLYPNMFNYNMIKFIRENYLENE